LLAPSLDLDHFPEVAAGRPGSRWGHDPQRVIDHAGQWNRWLRKRGVASCAGHFPGGRQAPASDGDEPTGSLATIEELLRADLLPYTALMPELDAIMTGHPEFANLEPGLPASLSSRVVRRLLRDQLGFDHHLVLTDDLDHDAITRRFGRGPDARLAIEAGNDLALICQRPDTAPAAAAAIRTLPTQRLSEAWERVERMRDKLHWPLPWSPAKWDENRAKIALLAAEVPEVT
jgi:beta-N-acetylhexosaminidase